MRLPTRDLVATVLVGIAGVLYGLWAIGVPLPGLGSVRVTGMVILALGFAASATAVVPGFEQLVHGDRSYLVLTSCLGLVALIGGVRTLVASSAAGLAALVVTMMVLWVVATLHHRFLAGAEPPLHRRPRHP